MSLSPVRKRWNFHRRVRPLSARTGRPPATRPPGRAFAPSGASSRTRRQSTARRFCCSSAEPGELSRSAGWRSRSRRCESHVREGERKKRELPAVAAPTVATCWARRGECGRRGTMSTLSPIAAMPFGFLPTGCAGCAWLDARARGLASARGSKSTVIHAMHSMSGALPQHVCSRSVSLSAQERQVCRFCSCAVHGCPPKAHLESPGRRKIRLPCSRSAACRPTGFVHLDTPAGARTFAPFPDAPCWDVLTGPKVAVLAVISSSSSTRLKKRASFSAGRSHGPSWRACSRMLPPTESPARQNSRPT